MMPAAQAAAELQCMLEAAADEDMGAAARSPIGSGRIEAYYPERRNARTVARRLACENRNSGQDTVSREDHAVGRRAVWDALRARRASRRSVRGGDPGCRCSRCAVAAPGPASPCRRKQSVIRVRADHLRADAIGRPELAGRSVQLTIRKAPVGIEHA